MTATRKIQIELPEDVAEGIDRRIASGQYSDVSAVILHALDDMHEDDPALGRWLKAEVLPTIERMDRDGPAGLTSEQVFGGLQQRYLARKRA